MFSVCISRKIQIFYPPNDTNTYKKYKSKFFPHCLHFLYLSHPLPVFPKLNHPPFPTTADRGSLNVEKELRLRPANSMGDGNSIILERTNNAVGHNLIESDFRDQFRLLIFFR